MEGFTDDSIEKEIKIALDNEEAIIKDLEGRLKVLIEQIEDKKNEIENLGFDPEDPKMVPAFVQDKKHEMTNEEWNDLLAQHSKLVFEMEKLIKEKNVVAGDILIYSTHKEN
ncbi:MAG TPA: hypothetical protein PK886_01050 [Candidatus Paceibacterota bacterium]|nr:hypothetical protein [Candidatus Paceibacterota bacterium]